MPNVGSITTLLSSARAALVVAGCALLGLGGCSYQLVSPPSRMINLESAKTAAPGETVVGARGARYGSVFDPGVAVASGGVRRGVSEGLEVDADASWARVTTDESANIDRNVFAGRLGAKMSNKGQWLAAFTGLGGGYSPAAGGFFAADVGLAISYPNCYVVPFGNAMIFGSQPIAAKRVDFQNSDGTANTSDTASFTYGSGLTAGVEIPLDHARCRQGLIPARIQLGLSAYNLIPSEGAIVTTRETSDGGTTVDTRGGHYGVAGLAIGVEVPF